MAMLSHPIDIHGFDGNPTSWLHFPSRAFYVVVYARCLKMHRGPMGAISPRGPKASSSFGELLGAINTHRKGKA